MYNWVQYKLGLNTDMDVLAGGHTGQTTSLLVTMASASSLVTSSGVWIENYASADANKVQFTDLAPTVHTPPSSISVTVNYDAAIAGGQVSVFALTVAGLTDATYTPANISSTLINAAGERNLVIDIAYLHSGHPSARDCAETGVSAVQPVHDDNFSGPIGNCAEPG